MQQPTVPSDARAQVSQGTVVIPRDLVALSDSTPPFSLEPIEVDMGFSLPDIPKDHLFHQVGISTHPEISSRTVKYISDADVRAANALGRVPPRPDPELTSAFHESLLLDVAPRIFSHPLMQKCQVCSKKADFGYVSSIVTDYTIRPYIVDQWAPLCEEDGACFRHLDEKSIEAKD